MKVRSIISMDMFSIAIATVASIIWTSLAHGSLSAAHASNAGYRAAATQEYTRFIVSATRAREVVLAAKPARESAGPPRQNAVSRANAPVVAVTAPGAGPIRVVLRRGADGDLFTQSIGTGRVDLTDPAVVALLDEAEARVRAAAGLRG